jgi:UDP-N-acetylglucosamine 2-epimerase
MKTILIVAGTRPEIIKTAPIALEAKKRENCRVHYCLTGQHKTMAQEALSIFNILPDEDLNIMRPNQTLNTISESVFAKLPVIIDKVKPDILLVQGDTTTAAMAALCAFNMKIPVGHIEAGLRSHNLDAPYPEELNRKVISCLAKYNFCPTEAARANLIKESVSAHSLYVTGNTAIDAIRFLLETKSIDSAEQVVPGLQTPYVLVTAHRRESFGDGFKNICEALRKCAELYSHYQFVYPVHLNPNVSGPVHQILGGIQNIHLIAPVTYLQMGALMKNCAFVLTDSGGIQEEAPSFGKYAIVMRDVTERMESVLLGYSELVGASSERIIDAVRKQILKPIRVNPENNPYGDGHTSERILNILTQETTC